MLFWVALIGTIASGFVLIYKTYAERQRTKKRPKQFGSLAAALGVKDSSVNMEATVTAELDGLPYRFRRKDARKYDPERFVLTVETPAEAGGSLLIRKETIVDRYLMRARISVELQTGDAEFDRTWYIESETSEFARLFFADSGKREAVRGIAAAGFSDVKLVATGTEVTVTASTDSPGDQFYEQPERIKDVVRRMRRLTQSLPEVCERRESAGRAGSATTPKITRAVDAALWIALAAAIAIQMFWMNGTVWVSGNNVLDLGGMFEASLKISLPLVIAYLWLAVRVLRGRSSSHKELLFHGGVAIIAIPWAVFGSMDLIDTALDFSQIVSHKTHLVDVQEYFGTRSTTYVAEVESWREGVKTEKIKIHGWTYDLLYPRKAQHPVVTVGTRPGVLGFEWFVNVE